MPGAAVCDVEVVDPASRSLRGWPRRAEAAAVAVRVAGTGLLRRGYGGVRGAIKRTAWNAAELEQVRGGHGRDRQPRCRTFVSAFAQVRAAIPSATLTIAGCTPQVSGPGIEIVGPVPASEVARFSARASVFCMPSRRELFGLVYIEAMHAGLPVVARRQGAAQDFVIAGETGFLVGGPGAPLAQRLIELLEEPDRCAAMGAAGKRLAASGYNWDHTQRAMWDVMRARLSSRFRLALQRDDAAPDRHAHRLGAVGHRKLAQNRGDVEFHRLVADAEPRRNRLVRQPLRQQAEHLQFSRRERLFGHIGFPRLP
jgi:hypothetical protein